MNHIFEQDFKNILDDKNIEWNKFDNATVLVAGANSFIATYIVLTLLYRNKIQKVNPTKVIALVRNIEKAKNKYAGYLNDENFELAENDVTKKYLTNSNIDYIFHLASDAKPSAFFKNPINVIKANTLGTINLLELAVEKNTKSFLYFSTGEVYGNIFETGIEEVNEDDYGAASPLEVRSCYLESKRMGENLCACWNYQYNLPTKIVRLSHTYGPGFELSDKRAFASFVNCVLNDENIVLKSKGEAKRSFCYLTDAIRAYFTVLLKGENANAYNVANDYEISILELANCIIKVNGNDKLKIVFDIDENSPSAKFSHGKMGIEKIKSLGWKPMIKEEIGFKRVIESFKS